MATPILAIACRCCNVSIENNKVICGAYAFDLVAIITSLVVGILGACSVISMAPALSFSLIGLGATISLAWTAMFASVKCCKPKYERL